MTPSKIFRNFLFSLRIFRISVIVTIKVFSHWENAANCKQMFIPNKRATFWHFFFVIREGFISIVSLHSVQLHSNHHAHLPEWEYLRPDLYNFIEKSCNNWSNTINFISFFFKFKGQHINRMLNYIELVCIWWTKLLRSRNRGIYIFPCQFYHKMHH